MARPLRIEYPGAWYHVMNRGRRREKIFTDSKDYELFIETLKEAVKMWNLSVSAYCLMPNHYHILVHTPFGNISRCMRHINGVYTQRFNIRYKIDGQLFRGRYKAILVDADNYLLELLRYIHRNPLRAKMVKSLDQYNWSSHHGYLSTSKNWDWLYKDFLLAMFSENDKQARQAYSNFIEEEETEEIKEFFGQKNLPSILGTEEFLNWIQEKFQGLRFHKEIPEATILTPDAERIFELVCQAFHVNKGSLLVSKRGTANVPRDISIYLLRRYTNKTLSEIGKYFHLNHYSSVSSVVVRIKRLIDNNNKIRKVLRRIEKNM